jgi:microcystin-dependent protein
MAYKKVGWKDYPDTTTPVNATNLNQMDEGLAAVDQELTTQKENATDMQDTIDQLNTGLSELNIKMESVRSHVGMIIQSTTLDTEAKVIAIYGGTSWTKIEGRFLLGTSPSYAVNATGGEATHKLTTPEMPSHSHGLNNHTHIIPALSGTTNTAGSHTHNSKDYWVANSGKGTAGYCGGSGTSAVLGDLNDIMYASGSHSHTVTTESNTTSGNSGSTATTGSGTAHNNMPPYKAVYIWERTA